VMTQVRVAAERYRMALQDLAVAKESSLVDQRLASYAKAGLSTRTDSELELIRAETRTLNSEYQRYAAYAAAQTAFGRIYNAIGLEVVPENIGDASLAELGSKVSARIAGIENDAFPTIATSAQTLPPLTVQIDAPRGENADISLVAPAVEKALVRNRIPVQAAGKPAPVLNLQLVLQPARDGVRRAEWLLKFTPADGGKASESRYVSTLPASSTPRTLAAFGEAAVVANLSAIEQWLRAGQAK